jgi:hypothetical protein
MKNQRGHFTPGFLPWIIFGIPALAALGVALLAWLAVRWWKGRSK